MISSRGNHTEELARAGIDLAYKRGWQEGVGHPVLGDLIRKWNP
jgi:hypothetical protein